jgi:hypothetical protein
VERKGYIMADYIQEPGILNLKFVFGDTFSCSLTFAFETVPIDLSAYTFESFTDETGIEFLVTAVDLAEGKINLSLTEDQTIKITDGENWYLTWYYDDVIQTILTGTITEAKK